MNWRIFPNRALDLDLGLDLLLSGLLASALLTAGCREATPPSTPSPEVIESMNRGVALMGQYDYQGAVEAFVRALRLEPELLEARLNLAIALFNRGRKEDQDLERGSDLLDQVLARDPENLHALYFQAIVLQHQGKAEEAIPSLERITAARPRDGAVWYLLGLCRQRSGQSAEADFLKAVEHRPYLFSAHYRLFQLAQIRGDQEAAQEHLARFKSLRESPLGESIELPQYNAMGDLALVQPLPSTRAKAVTPARYQPQGWSLAFESESPLPGFVPSGMSAADLNRDGQVDVVLASSLHVLAGRGGGGYELGASPESSASPGRSLAIGDVDHDGQLDLFSAGLNGPVLWLAHTNETWSRTELAVAPGAAPIPTEGALLLDADHDGDLDLLTAGVLGCDIWQNNTDGTFTNLSASAEWRPSTAGATAILPGDLDNDRDLDLVVLRRGAPAVALVNHLLGNYQASDLAESRVHGDQGGVLQDFTGDGLLDLLVLGGNPSLPALFHGDGAGNFRPCPVFASVAEAASSWGQIHSLRVGDLDLDGDLDGVLIGDEAHLLLNDGQGRFVLQPRAWVLPPGAIPDSLALADVNSDWIPDLLIQTVEDGKLKLREATAQLSVPSTVLGVSPTGTRSRDGRTRCPATGYGVRLTARAGLHEQTLLHTGLNGGPHQFSVPATLGLNGAPRADYVEFHWTDGVTQVELGLASGQNHTVSELERKISSCPILFAWNGDRMEFITDFAGVGGLGYFAAPGEYGQPQVLEHIKLEPSQLKPRKGRYEMSICEPMEESAYVDRLELVAVDHPEQWMIHPDERAVGGAPPPTHDLLVIDQAVFPVAAYGPDGMDCLEGLRDRDRHYAYEPPLDRRFIGFCQEHSLELEFGPRPAAWSSNDRVFLFVAGFIEYPYSQTVYAASQAGVNWQPIRVDSLRPDGQWERVVLDGGWPGGMGRVFTLDLSGHSWHTRTRLRLVTNLEIYYDQIALGRHLGETEINRTTVPLTRARLQRLGFPREYSPDGRMPLIYDYHWLDASSPFAVLRGAYTRYGAVDALLAAFDDQYVLVAPGDEIRLEFDASVLPDIPSGYERSFLLVSHAYCKDMDLYTGTSQSLEPLPFQGMSRYPYPESERLPDTPHRREFHKVYCTRQLQ